MKIVPPRLPIHLVPKSFLREVPERVYRNDEQDTLAFSCQPTEPLKLRIGGWINLPLGHQQPVSLLLFYRDTQGEHMLLVDEMNARGASELLLSGEVEIPAGDIETMAIYCGGINDPSVWASNLEISQIAQQAETASKTPQAKVG
ncbi:MAG: hypothetical protein KJO62_08800 [Gammaproteobacteria bacterium]|nr:hypothetical protein [Gammaproteobacteria bacterium]NND39860.1 hypothetical protein [Pseudomonadales bacterium]NNM11092.1 hypothetical protein [Pseudomonadales bacterium]RZV48194.1 MAG: hypothetical protein EX270_13915 [Pseudomonadales bacterium]